MNKLNCYRIKAFLEDVFAEKRISLKIEIINKYSKGSLFWRMRIKIDRKYKHLLNHIHSTAYWMCALTGEYLEKNRIERGWLYLS